MTSDDKQQRAREKANARKEKSRNRRLSMGIVDVRVGLAKTEMAQLDELIVARAGEGEPYDKDEYISTLIRRDHESLIKQQQKHAQTRCQKCHTSPPNCEGLFKGDRQCALGRFHAKLRL